jgi:hypothetical protein
VPGLAADEVRPKFLAVPLTENVRVEVAGAREMRDVHAISFEVALQLGQGEVMDFQDEQLELPPNAGIERRRAARVALRRRSHRDHIEVDAVLNPEGRLLARQIKEPAAAGIRHDRQHVDVRCGSVEAVRLDDGESADAVEFRAFIERAIEIVPE